MLFGLLAWAGIGVLTRVVFSRAAAAAADRGGAVNAVLMRDVFRIHRTAEGDAAALQGMTLDVEEGEVVVVLGPSGSGKSTLLRILAALERPSAGVARVLGEDVAHLHGRRAAEFRARNLGLVDQHYDARPDAGPALRRDRRAPAGPARRRSGDAAGAGDGAAGGASGWGMQPAPVPASCRAASSSAWRCARRSPTGRSCCWRTSRPASSMRPTPPRSTG